MDIQTYCNHCNKELVPYIDTDMSCSCHINPPCAKCTDTRMECPECGEIFEEELTHNTNIKPYIQPLLKTPIESNISYETQRSGGWVLVHGTAKLGLTRNEIKNKLGQFDKYNMFKIKSYQKQDYYISFNASWCTD